MSGNETETKSPYDAALATLHVFICLASTLWVVKSLLQLPHACSFTPRCTLTWFLRLWFVVNVWLHISHLKRASFVLRATLALIPAFEATLRNEAFNDDVDDDADDGPSSSKDSTFGDGTL